jgi:hypothetical protein
MDARGRTPDNVEDTERKIAGQIFCEMLGQTCYPEYYKRKESEYQEVLPLFVLLSDSQAFILHGHHVSLYIYYARLPNEYLKDIVSYGEDYVDKCINAQTVHLRRTKKFRMTNTAERVEFFTLFAQLLMYLISGKSHVGYLLDYTENPIHDLVRSYYLKSLISG